MSHEITIRKNGKAEFAYAGDKAWHGLGSELTQGASIEDWIMESGLNWEIFESQVSYDTMEGQKHSAEKRVLFRSDTLDMLSIVGSGYKLVQPAEVLEFFRDLTTINGMSLSAAGSLFGGKKFWATAKTNHSTTPIVGDTTDGYLLFVTSCDLTVSNTVKFSSTRTVCNNTLSVALNDGNKRVVKQSHRSVWDPVSVKLDMGLLDESWYNFSESLKKLAELEVSDKYVRQYVQSKVYMPGIPVEDQNMARVKEADKLIELYNHGDGANFAKGSAYGILQAFTNAGTHGTGKRDPSAQFMTNFFGKFEKLKNEVFNDMIALLA